MRRSAGKTWTGEEVSCELLRPLFQQLDADELPPSRLELGTGLLREDLCRRGGRTSWDVFVRVVENARSLWGDQELSSVGAGFARVPPMSLARVARAVVGASELYAWLAGESSPLRHLVTCIDAQCWDVSRGHVSFEVTVRAGYSPSDAFFIAMKGMLEAVPRWLALDNACVDVELREQSAFYDIRFAVTTSIVTTLRESVRRVRRLRVAADELSAAHDLLNRQYQELRKAQATLRRSEEKFRALIENSSDFVLLSDSRGTVTYLSPSVERITGQNAEALLGTPHWNMAHPDDRASLVLALTELGAVPGGSTTLRYRFDTPHRGKVWLEGTARNMLGDDRVRAILVNYRDVTDRVRLEQQLLESRKLESIGRLAGGIAHDFNNLLTGMLGNAQLGLRKTRPNEAAHEYLQHIQEYARRGAGLTGQLLAFARKQVAQPKVVDLNRLIGQTRKLLDRLIGDQVEIVTLLLASPGTVQIDPNQFQQVLVNLAINARDAMPEGGTLTIRTELVTVSERSMRQQAGMKPGPYIVLAVSDTGVGMDSETMENLFEPFFTTKEPGHGTGLGLATCHGIVKQSGGHIEVRSRENAGTTFEILLPLAELSESPVTVMDHAIEPPRGTETVLLVEDELTVRRCTAELLRGVGYTVLTASNGQEALEISRGFTEHIDAVITDVVMPKMNGPRLVELLRLERPAIKYLYMSGYASESLLDATDRLVRKPFDVKLLATRLREILCETAGEATAELR